MLELEGFGMIKSRRAIATIYLPLIVIGTAVLIAASLIAIIKVSSQFGDFGKNQKLVLQAYSESRKISLLLEQAVFYSQEKALKRLGKNGGFYNSSDCGTETWYSIVYNLWNRKDNIDELCLPNQYVEFEKLFKKEFLRYLNGVNYYLNFSLLIIGTHQFSPEDFELAIEPTKVNLITTVPIPIRMEREQVLIGTFEFRPVVSSKLNYNLSIYEDAKKAFLEAKAKCTGARKRECVIDVFKRFLPDIFFIVTESPTTKDFSVNIMVAPPIYFAFSLEQPEK